MCKTILLMDFGFFCVSVCCGVHVRTLVRVSDCVASGKEEAIKVVWKDEQHRENHAYKGAKQMKKKKNKTREVTVIGLSNSPLAMLVSFFYAYYREIMAKSVFTHTVFMKNVFSI